VGCNHLKQSVRLEVFAVVKMSILVFWIVKPCALVGRYQRFVGTYCLHVHGWNCYLPTSPQGVATRRPTSMKQNIFYGLASWISLCTRSLHEGHKTNFVFLIRTLNIVEYWMNFCKVWMRSTPKTVRRVWLWLISVQNNNTLLKKKSISTEELKWFHSIKMAHKKNTPLIKINIWV
jgi:hypothetical protein